MSDKITCPKCGEVFNVEEAITSELKAHFKGEYEKKIAEQAGKFNEERKKINAERDALNQQKEEQEKVIKEQLAKLVIQEKDKIQRDTAEAFEQKLKSLQEENEKRKAENKSLKEREVALLRQEAEIKEKQEELSLKMEKELLEKQRQIEDKARLKERESFELERIKLLKQIDDNKKLAEEMKCKAEQGSMEMQGEVLEMAIEDLLRKTYPYDRIEEVPKGTRGADSIQTVFNTMQQECGSIVYESKNTKHFANDWIDKLKQDQVACKADIAVLVTKSYPSDMDRFGLRSGVWVCGFHEVKSLSLVLREILIRSQSVKQTQVNKGDKMELLYSYLTSNEFVQNVKRIVENYDSMLQQLNSEKKAMHKIWATREKQIWVVQENISSLFGSIKGIAGNELETSSVLELDDLEDN